MEPLLFEPLLRRIRWGGRRLGTVLGKPIGDETDYAESWEIADQPSGQSVVATGQYAGQTLSQLVSDHSRELLGRHSDATQFPLLIKFLDANDWLSLQVHPNDEQARELDVDENGKTEAWIILDAEPQSLICAGLKEGVTRDEFERHLTNGTVEETLNMIPAVAGDCIFVPARTVHALGPGILLAEVQQQSNLTYRLHDWGRLGTDGKPREIHVSESLSVTDFDRGPVMPVEVPVSGDDESGNTTEKLVSCSYFQIVRHQLASQHTLMCDDQFRILMVLSGRVTIQTESGAVDAAKGSTVLIPACLQTVSVLPLERATFLEITLE